MEIKTTNNKMLATRAFINEWLKDQTWYCNSCGKRFNSQEFACKQCCDTPSIGRNYEHCMAVINQNKIIKESRKNDFASTDDKSIRWGISIPPQLMCDLENYFRKNYKEKLFQEDKDLTNFMREFPQFSIAKKV